jgi:Ni2+-binding GTPase involved in maturation of urease and hydrogenase
MRIILIAGLPGSGKTHLAREFAEMDSPFSWGTDVIVVDDISDSEQLPKYADVLIVTDVNFCSEAVRGLAMKELRKRYPRLSHEWYFFENAPWKCRNNVLHRNDGRDVEATIARFAVEYQVPFGYTPIPIWHEAPC